MRFRGWILAGLLALVSQGVVAADQECVPRAEMQEIARHFTQFQGLANNDYCYDGSETSALIEAIQFMRQTDFDDQMSPSPDQLFSGRFSSSWWEYFIGRITDFQIDSGCPRGVAAYVYFFGTSMYVCSMALTPNFTAMDRASIFMHEARHIDGFPHVTCSRGARAGLQGACDDRMSTGGSYAVTVETYAQLARYGSQLNPALRSYARAASVVYADEAFDTPVTVNREAKFLLMTRDLGFHQLNSDGSTALEHLGLVPSLGHIIMRSNHMVLFPDDKNLPAKYVFAKNEGDIAQAAGDLANEYNGQTPQQRANLVDLFIGAQWSARVYRDSVRFQCDPRSTTTRDLNLNGQRAVALIFPEGIDRASRQLKLLTESGTIYSLGCSNASSAFLNPTAERLDQSYKRIYKSGQLVLGLTPNGQLFKITGNTSTPFVTEVDGQIHELVPRQEFQFFDSQN